MFRFDKLTQKAQEALQQTQSSGGNQRKPGDVPAAPAGRAGRGAGGHRPAGAGKVRRAAGRHRRRGARASSPSLPKTTGMQPGMYLSPPLNQVLERAFDEAIRFKDEFVSTEHLLLAIAEQRSDPAGQLLERAGATHDAILKALVSGARQAAGDRPESRNQVPGAGALRPRPDRIGARRQTRPGDRARRRDPPRDAGAQPAHQEQPGADRRARRRQDRHRGRPGAAHRARRRAGPAEEQEAGRRSTWAA